MTSLNLKIGTIDEKGYLAGMGRRGFTSAKCLLELYANNLDSLERVHPPANFTKKVVVDIKTDKTSLIDNGAGMFPDQVENMFALHKSNHNSDTSRGVSGIGAKPAMSILSEKSTVKVFTRAVGGNYLRVTVPWGDIHSNGVYTGMINVCEMTAGEKANFIKERSDNGMLNMNEAHGTTTEFNTNNTLSGVVEATFAPIKEEYALKNLLDRAGIVFGRDKVEFVYKSQHKPGNPIPLEQYDYFGVANSKFYTGKAEHIVEQWYCDKDGKDRYILDYNGLKFEITQTGRGFSKDPEEVKTNMTGYSKVGTFKIVCGMRIDKTVFDPEAPVLVSGEFTPGNDNMKYLGSERDLECKEFIWSMKLVRNNQLIGLIPNPYVALGSFRANGDSQIAGALVQTEIQFNPISSHDNHQDRVTGIQENKNQFDGKSFPVQLARIAGYLRNEKAKEVIKFMKDCVLALEPVIPEPAIPEPAIPEPAIPEPAIPTGNLPPSPLSRPVSPPVELLYPEVSNANELVLGESGSDAYESDVSEEEYIMGEDLIAYLDELYDTIKLGQKITKLELSKILRDIQIRTFGVILYYLVEPLGSS